MGTTILSSIKNAWLLLLLINDAIRARFNSCALLMLIAVALTHIEVRGEERTVFSDTVLVDQSSEIIRVPNPLVSALPKTISIDAMTAEEVQKVRQNIHDGPYGLPPDGIGGRPRCMAWLFKRASGKTEFLPVGFVTGTWSGVLKINGLLRPSYVFAGTDNSANISVGSFQSTQTYAERMKFEDRKSSVDTSNSRAQEATLEIRLHGFKVDVSKMRCSLLETQCRRYTSGLRSLKWLYDATPKRIYKEEKQIRVETSSPIEIAVEDMCPYKHEGVVEQPWKSRLWGEELGVALFGFMTNPSLSEALEPYIPKKIKNKQ